MSLILVVAVVSVLGFQGWFKTFSENIFIKAQTDSSLSFNNLRVEIIVGNNLYLNNRNDFNISLNKISVNGVDCVLSNFDLNLGLNKLNISSCLDNSTNFQNVVVISEGKLIEKFLYLDTLTPVSVNLGPSGGNLIGYAYSENFGFISFSGPGYGVVLNNSQFTGFAYAEQFGFISFNGSLYNVSELNDVLTGYVYSENLGYISFNGPSYNVSIKDNVLEGFAYGENVGFIHFNPSGIYGNVTYS